MGAGARSHKRKKPAAAGCTAAAAAAASLACRGCSPKRQRPVVEAEEVSKDEKKSEREAENGTATPLVRGEDLRYTCFEDLLGVGSVSTPQPRVGLATCSRGCPPQRLLEWLFWHLSEGVSVVFLRWEGELDPELKSVLQGPIRRGELVLTLLPKYQGSSAFQAVMARQLKFTHSAMKAARQRGCDFLLHLDDDELLYPLKAGCKIPDVLSRHRGSERRCIHFANYEAVFPFCRSTQRPFSRVGARFRTDFHVLYCNGKSAANLKSGGEVFCSGVHHFCRYNRSFEQASPEFGLHDSIIGCTDPSCCTKEDAAVVLHFDCPSLQEWRVKFQARARSKLTDDDKCETDIFPFKGESLEVLANGSDPSAEEAVYRRWRCLPGQAEEDFSDKISGAKLAARMSAHVEAARKHREELFSGKTSRA